MILTKWKKSGKNRGRKKQNNNSICPKDTDRVVEKKQNKKRAALSLPTFLCAKRKCWYKICRLNSFFIQRKSPPLLVQWSARQTAFLVLGINVNTAQMCLWINNGYLCYCAQRKVKIHKWILSDLTNRNDAKGSWGAALRHPLVYL